jgi:hypothetical protein
MEKKASRFALAPGFTAGLLVIPLIQKSQTYLPDRDANVGIGSLLISLECKPSRRIKRCDNAAFGGQPQGYWARNRLAALRCQHRLRPPENAGSMAVSWPMAGLGHAIVVTLPRN